MPKGSSPAIIFVAILASLLEIIDSSIVNVALPTMMGNLGATLEDISLVITGYAIANAIILPVSSWFGERIGRRKYYLGCIAAFTITSVACGMAPNLFTLTIFRIFQGLAGGALLPTSQTLIYEQFPKEKAGMAGAIFGMSVMIGPTLGPVMGGYLTDTFGWRSIFNVNLPLGMLALFVGLNTIYDRDKSKDTTPAAHGFDGVGLALLVSGIGCLQYVLERGDADAWFASTGITISALIAAISLPGFIWWELRVKNPIINVRLFQERIVACGVLLMGSVGFFLYALILMLPVYVTTVFHYDATQTGMLFIPGSILTAMLMPFVGKQMQAGRDPKILIFIGLLSLELCIYSLTFFSPLTPREEIIRMLFIRGFGMAFLFVPINSSILSQFGGATMGQVAGLLNLSRQIGGSIGIALTATLLTSHSHQNRADLSSHVSLLNPATRGVYYPLVESMKHKFSDAVGMTQQISDAAIKAIDGKVRLQVFIMSFNQMSYIFLFIFMLAFIPLYMLQLRVKAKVVSDAH